MTFLPLKFLLLQILSYKCHMYVTYVRNSTIELSANLGFNILIFCVDCEIVLKSIFVLRL